MVSARHLDVGHPGPNENKPLLKNFKKYIRISTSNLPEPDDLVCSKKIVEDEDYELVNEVLWNFIKRCFGADYAIKRMKDTVKSTSFRAEYSVQHEEHLKVLILPKVDQISVASLDDVGKPLKIYYGADTTFA